MSHMEGEAQVQQGPWWKRCKQDSRGAIFKAPKRKESLATAAKIYLPKNVYFKNECKIDFFRHTKAERIHHLKT